MIPSESTRGETGRGGWGGGGWVSCKSEKNLFGLRRREGKGGSSAAKDEDIS